jgi:hypothetical protein
MWSQRARKRHVAAGREGLVGLRFCPDPPVQRGCPRKALTSCARDLGIQASKIRQFHGNCGRGAAHRFC